MTDTPAAAQAQREARHRLAARRHRRLPPAPSGLDVAQADHRPDALRVLLPRDVGGAQEQHPAAGRALLRRHRPAARLRRDHRDRVGPLRGRHAPHAHGRLARRRPHDGHPHRRPEPHRRPARGHARGRRRHRRDAQAVPGDSPGARPDRGRGRPADQLPQLRERRGRTRDRRHVRRGGRQRRAPGPAVQRALPQHQHVPQLCRRGRGQAHHALGAHAADRRRAQRQRHRGQGVEGHAGAAGAARDQLRVPRERGDAQGRHRALDRAARRRAGAVHAHGPAVRRGAARPLWRLQDARPAEHALHGERQPRRDRQPRDEPR